MVAVGRSEIVVLEVSAGCVVGGIVVGGIVVGGIVTVVVVDAGRWQ
jgi:hypothetical protein